MIAYRFKPVDTWFFKEARPMDGVGGSELASVFPPPVRTLLGALRAAVGDAKGVDWLRYPAAYPELAEAIGDEEHYGTLQCRGVFVKKGGELLYPLPFHIAHLKHEKFAVMPIGPSMECDIGTVRMPQLPTEGAERYKIEEGGLWVQQKDLLAILEGGAPSSVVREKVDEEEFRAGERGFVYEESRVGIGRDNATRTVEEGKLYMTRHLRLAGDVRVVLAMEAEEPLIESAAVRLGGEGRAAGIDTAKIEKVPRPRKPSATLEGVFVTLLTPGLVDPVSPMGERAVSACVGKSFREGGFDIKNVRSRAAKSYLPAGSTWFYEMGEESIERFIDQHHETMIGEENELGRGRIVCGYWKKQTEVQS